MPYQIKNGIVYGTGAVSLTQAQYDALSTAEKNNGTVYYIYDSDAVMDAEDVGIDGGGTLQDLAGSIATIETSPATAAHAVGSYILWNGQLYEVTSAIAVGETLTVGSNITATTLTTGLMREYTQIGTATLNTTTQRSVSLTSGSFSDFTDLFCVVDDTSARRGSFFIPVSLFVTGKVNHIAVYVADILRTAVFGYVDDSTFSIRMTSVPSDVTLTFRIYAK